MENVNHCNSGENNIKNANNSVAYVIISLGSPGRNPYFDKIRLTHYSEGDQITEELWGVSPNRQRVTGIEFREDRNLRSSVLIGLKESRSQHLV